MAYYRRNWIRVQTEAKMRAMVTLGVPYTEEEIVRAQEWMDEQGTQIEKNLYTDPDFEKTYEADKKYARENGEEFIEMRNREVVALIAYIQRLGTDIKVQTKQEITTTENPIVMLKFVKGNLENIDGVEIYPIISLLIFFIFFVVLFWWVFTAKKAHIKEVSNIPLDTDPNTDIL